MSIRQGGNTIAGAVGKYPLNERNISNCITNVPQDIKLELNNGTLTLKAGSKVYVPNGAGVFDEVVIANDIVKNDWSSGSDILFLTVQNGSYIYGGSVSSSGSGTSTSTTSGLYYRTTENYIYANNNSSLPKQSLPIAIITVSNGTPFSIDEIFNGSGYIGSTMFALPRVKGLIPDGRNADGSLKNIETEITNVQIISGGSSDQKNITVGIRNDGTLWLNENFKYLEQDNKNFDTSSGNTFDACPFCVYDNTSGKISKFTPKTAFHAVDYGDTEYMAHQAMPSKKYIDLTLGASGSNYTAPADGYVCFYMAQPGSHDLQVYLSNETAQLRVRTYQNVNDIACWIPVSKGDTFRLEYTYNSGSYQFRFIYAQGAQ